MKSYSIMTPTTMPIIGRTTLVSVCGTSDVPAKVDTGADSSSVWASHIVEHGDTLNFTLFGEGSSFYTGASHETRDYATIKVSSSNGKSESRYVVTLPLEIDGISYEGRFTLAVRASMAYPILLGRHFLEGEFLVDVSKGLHPTVHRQLHREKRQRIQSTTINLVEE